MNNKFIGGLVLCAIVFGGGGYYLGTKKMTGAVAVSSPDGRSAFTTNRQSGAGIQRTGRNGGGFSGGEIVSIDAESISVKSPDGGSKIVFYGGSTSITKMASGTIAELSPGQNIIVMGKANPDGSITAESISLRPQMQNRPTEASQ